MFKKSSVSRPYSSEKNSDATLANYPGLIYLLHMDDCVVGSSSWTPRVGTAVIGSSVAYSKDANGVYVASQSTLTATGTMPVVTKNKYLLNINMGTPASGTHILTFDFGDSTTGDAFKANGAIFFNTTQYIAAAFESAIPTGQRQCHASYSDWVSGSPAAFRIIAPATTTAALNYKGAWVTLTVYAVNDLVDQGGLQYKCLIAHTAGTFATDLGNNDWVAVTLSNETVTCDNTVNTAPSVAGVNCIPTATVNIGSFSAAIDTQRLVLGAVFVLSKPLSKAFIQCLCQWMAVNPGKLYPGLRNLT